MARVFDPLVFQPSVFQVGTLDVATKRRKWLSLSVPGSGRMSGATAFAVSRDSAGILIGVRDNAAPQFAVSRDADGLLLSAWPVVPSYVASGYVLGINSVSTARIRIGYWRANFTSIAESAAQITTSLDQWQRLSVTAVVPAEAAYVGAGIYCQKSSPQGAYWTGFQLEGGTVASDYRIGGVNLLLNPQFTSGLAYWNYNGLESGEPLYAVVFSHAPNLPSTPPPGITTGLKYQSDGWEPGAWYSAFHRIIALPTP